jgi:hypothetical protein
MLSNPQTPTSAGPCRRSWAFVELLGAAALRTLGDLKHVTTLLPARSS